jgi:hypothetical protein
MYLRRHFYWPTQPAQGGVMPRKALSKNAVVVWHQQLDDDDPFHKPSTYPCKILAEGDSWFSMNAIPGANLLNSIRLAQDTIIVNCAMPGDTIRNMIKMRNNPVLQSEITGGIGWDAILLSGGGNDVIDDAKWIIPAAARKPRDDLAPEAYCDLEQLEKTLDVVSDGYQKIFSMRDAARSSCKGKPILIHTYDKATPRDSPTTFLSVRIPSGPWLCPAMVAAKIPESRWNDVSDFVLGSLADRLLQLNDPQRNIHVVDTRDTLDRAQLGTLRTSGDWQNEIHPSSTGYNKLSGVVSPILASLL